MSMAEALAGACAIVVTVVYVRDVLGGTEAQFSIVVGGAGLGSAAAAILLSRIYRSHGTRRCRSLRGHRLRHRWTAAAVITGGIVLSISLLPGWMAPPLIVFGFLWVLNGSGPSADRHSLVDPGCISYLYRRAWPRRFAAQFAITHACWLVSYPLVGHLAGALGPPITFSICGAACLGITVVALVIGRGEKGAHVHASVNPKVPLITVPALPHQSRSMPRRRWQGVQRQSVTAPGPRLQCFVPGLPL